MQGYKTLKGRFKPRNPGKYRGDARNIIYRSGWELKLMNYLDRHPNVITWASEELVIPYLSPIDNRVHRYFTDFVIQVKKRDGSTATMVIEVKPSSQTKPPRKSKDKHRMIQEHVTYLVNNAKWEAARSFCEQKGWEFKIMTEKELGIK